MQLRFCFVTKKSHQVLNKFVTPYLAALIANPGPHTSDVLQARLFRKLTQNTRTQRTKRGKRMLLSHRSPPCLHRQAASNLREYNLKKEVRTPR